MGLNDFDYAITAILMVALFFGLPLALVGRTLWLFFSGIGGRQFIRAARELGVEVDFPLWGSPSARGWNGELLLRVSQDGRVEVRDVLGMPLAFRFVEDLSDDQLPKIEGPSPFEVVALFDAPIRRALRAYLKDQPRGVTVSAQEGALVIAGPLEKRDSEALVRRGKEALGLFPRMAARARMPVASRLTEMVIKDPASTARAAALRELLGLGAETWEAARAHGLNDPAPEVRLVAAIGPPPDVEVLNALVREESIVPALRAQAREALGRLKGEAGVEEGNLSLSPDGGGEGQLSIAQGQGDLALVKK